MHSSLDKMAVEGTRFRKPVSSAPSSIPVTLAICKQRPLVHDDFQELRCVGHGRHGKLDSMLKQPPDLHVSVFITASFEKLLLRMLHTYYLDAQPECFTCTTCEVPFSWFIFWFTVELWWTVLQ